MGEKHLPGRNPVHARGESDNGTTLSAAQRLLELLAQVVTEKALRSVDLDREGDDVGGEK